MELNNLTAISPVDGRYRKQVAQLDEYFSEYALIKHRVIVEVEYFLFLAGKKFFKLPSKAKQHLRHVADNFNLNDAQQVKQIESITNHDVKAVEYFLKQELEKNGGAGVKEWIHFALTSQDINNTAIPLSWKHCMEHDYLPAVVNLLGRLQQMAGEWNEIPMLARTHGQPASPTTLGKEWMVFVERLERQLEQLSHIPFAAKFESEFAAITVAPL